MLTQPLVSVLMTAYNREKYIAEAIESVLASSYTNFELIIVDDFSKDKTVEIARKYETRDNRIRVYVNETNLGDYPNRNRAASYAKGKYIKYLDSDDLIYSSGLEVFVSGMEKHPEAVLGLCSRLAQEEEPFPILIPSKESYRRHFFRQSFLDSGPSATIIRKDVFDEFGGFSGKRMIGDIELWLKIAAKYPVLILSPALIFWRIHEGQEFTAGVQSGIYFESLLPLMEGAMLSPACPLSELEKNKILQYFRKIKARKIIKLVLKEKQLGRFPALVRQSGLKAMDFVNAAFFIKKGING